MFTTVVFHIPTVPGAKPVPVTISVNAPLPALTEFGFSPLMTGSALMTKGSVRAASGFPALSTL